MSNFRRMLIGGNIPKPAPRLPKEYQEVAWVYTKANSEETKMQYTFSPFLALPSVEIKFDIDNLKNTHNTPFYGATKYNTSSTYGKIRSTFYQTNTVLVCPGNQKDFEYTVEPNYVNSYLITIKNGTVNIKTPDSEKVFNYDQDPGWKLYNLYHGNMDGKLYYFKLWSGEELILDLVPCYNRSTKEVGFYNLVDGTFRSKAYIAGPIA